MNKNLEFLIMEKSWILRWNNWKNFLDTKTSILNKKISNFSILFVCCNSYSVIIKCLDYLKSESNQDFDIIIVDNSTNEEESNLFYNLGKENKNISIIRPIDNLWWSWWFSMWMEYVIDMWYDYMLIFEDDIIPIEKNIVTTFIEQSEKNKLLFNECLNAWNSFWYFHLACYPIDFIKNVWVVDPRFFLKSDDLEWAERVERVIKKNWYKKASTWKHHYHPNLKKDWRKIRVTYLAIRNYLTTLTKYFTIKKCSYFFTLFLYIWYWISKFFFEWSINLLKFEICAIKDYLFWNIWYQYNKKILAQLFNQNLSKPKDCNDSWISIEELNKISNSMFNLYWKITWDYNWFYKVKFSKSIKDLKNGVIVNWIYSNLYPVFINFNKILAINEFDFISGKVNVYIYENNKKFRLLRTMLGFIVSMMLYIPIFILVTIKILISLIVRFLRSLSF